MPTTQESNKNPEYLYMYFRVAFNPLHFIASIWCANPTIDSRFRLSQTLKLQHTQLLAVVWTKVMEFGAYLYFLQNRTFSPICAKLPKYKAISLIICLHHGSVPGAPRSDKVETIFSRRHFLQKLNERILLYYYETLDLLVFVRFLEEIEDTENTF